MQFIARQYLAIQWLYDCAAIALSKINKAFIIAQDMTNIL
jgi:hypothetical protein